MVGEILIINGVEYEVVWSGGEGLVADRETKPTGVWTPPKRLYNKKDKTFWKELQDEVSETPQVQSAEDA